MECYCRNINIDLDMCYTATYITYADIQNVFELILMHHTRAHSHTHALSQCHPSESLAFPPVNDHRDERLMAYI